MNDFNIGTVIGHHYYKKLIDSDSIIVDLGSHTGTFSKAVSKEHNCSCYAVEPCPESFEKITEDANLKKFNYAISDTCGEVTLYLHRSDSMGHTILKGRPRNDKHITVPSITLETLLGTLNIKKIDILKIDIEGAEIQLFDSTPASIIEKIKQITMEFHSFDKYFGLQSSVDREIDYLKSIGFFYIDFTKNKQDVLFLNRRFYSLSECLKIKYLAKNTERVVRKLKRMGILN